VTSFAAELPQRFAAVASVAGGVHPGFARSPSGGAVGVLTYGSLL